MKMTMKIFLWLFVASIIAKTAFSQKVGSTSMQYLEVLPCAHGTAVGEAYTVWATGAEAIFWNPAGMALIQGHEFSTTYIQWIFDTQQGAISYAGSLGNFGAVGFQCQFVDYGYFDEARIDLPLSKSEPYPYLTGKQFHPYSYLVGLTYAKKLTDRFSTGVSFKFAHEALYDDRTVMIVDAIKGTSTPVNTSGNAYLFDIGMHYNTGFHSIQVGAAVQNFGPEVKYATDVDKSPVPLLFRVGVAADILGTNSLLFTQENTRVGLALDLFQSNDSGQHIHTGMEFEFINAIAFRIGYRTNYDFGGLTFGGGVRQTYGMMDVSLDYSYASLNEYNLGSAHRISLGVKLQ